jgi:hypothetical protein
VPLAKYLKLFNGCGQAVVTARNTFVISINIFVMRWKQELRGSKDDRRECFGDCNSLQKPEQLLLHRKHYAKERKKMTEALDIHVLTLHFLFTTARGSATLVAFLEKTKIATASWLLAIDFDF